MVAGIALRDIDFVTAANTSQRGERRKASLIVITQWHHDDSALTMMATSP
ncbi:hypothetical protein MHM95_04145 [Pseudoalteromonas sp. CnMc7-15]|nr:hypothetical protein [Pseudoalteromonas sp. CnMc7-15]MCG7565468.1 hypothetical protein [Pseudoalteromonas sp. CnMc7-15]